MSSQFSQKIDAKIQKLHETTMRAEQFDKRLMVLSFAVHSSTRFSISDLQENGIDASNSSIRTYLLDLMSVGYVERVTVWTYSATEKAKQLFGVKG
ncbi:MULTISPECIES: hypothetical protein [unclassified Acinetobacter]|uniref:hypothetical protein n=1 Tax=unclassified Acinetobacter TaxID=196816 RepID=UPI0015D2514E|nr:MULTISPECIES: hypothetical protein [unclassified Acinetobacter]